MYNRPINYEVQWASTGTPLKPSTEKIRNGWSGAEKPLVQHMNWILNRIDGAIGYFLEGAVEWGEEVNYPSGKLVAFQGELYRSIQPSTNKLVTNTTYWEKAFFSTIDGKNIQDEIDKILNQDGYLTKYLKVSSPVSPNRLDIGSVQANVGLAETNSYNMGYSFDGYNTTGMFLNGTTLTFLIGGVTRLTVPSAVPLLTDKSSNVATTDWVQRLIEEKIGSIDTTANRLPVGAVFFSVNEQNPNATLGYGTWVRFAEGQVLVGKSTIASHPSWKKEVYNTFGSDSHQITQQEMPTHYHGYAGDDQLGVAFSLELYNNFQSSYDAQSGYGKYRSKYYRTTSDGGNQAHNNVQPSIVVNIWRRTA